MATISNSIQGLNETVGLLKQILIAVQKDDKKNKSEGEDSGKTQAKDVSSSAVILSKIDKKGAENIKTVILAFEPLDKMSDKVGEKAKSLAEAIKILTNKDIVEGLKRCQSISDKSISSAFITIYKVMDYISNIARRINTKRIRDFANTIKMLTKAIKRTIMSLYMIAGLVLVAAIVGIIAIYAWKFILAGFTAILATALLIVGISFILKKISAMSKNMIKDVLKITYAVYALASIVLVSVVVGLLAVYCWELILIGFATIVAIVFGILLVLSIIRVISAGLKMLTMKIGGIKMFRHLFADGVLPEMPKEVGDIIKLILAIGMIPIISVIVGFIAINCLETMIYGFIAIAIMLTVIVLIMNIVGGMAKATEYTQKALMGVAILLLALAVVVLIMVGVTMLIKKYKLGWNDLLKSMAMMTLLILGAALLIKVTGRLGKPSLKSILVLGMVGLIIVALTFVVKKLIDITKVAEEIGWNKVWKTIGNMGLIVTALTAFMMGIGFLAMLPLVGVAIAIGGAMVLGVAGVAYALAQAIKAIVDAAKAADEYGIDKIPGIASKMATTLTSFLNTIADELSGTTIWKAALIGWLIRPIGNVVNICSKFIDMVTSFSTEDCGPNEVRTVYFDEKTSEYKLGKKVDLVKVGTQIASSFSKFVMILANNLEGFKGKHKRALKRVTKCGIVDIVNACSNFVEMISGFADGKDGSIAIYETDENGNLIKEGNDYKKRWVNIHNIAPIIAGAFSSFAMTLANQLENFGWKQKKRLKRLKNSGITEIVSTCTSFVEMISAFEGSSGDTLYLLYKDENGNYIVDKNGEYKRRPINIGAIGYSIVSSLSSFVNALSKFSFGGAHSGAAAISAYTKKIEDLTDSLYDLCNLNYKKLSEQARHMERLAESMSKVAQAIDELNSKELNIKLDQLEKLKDGVDLSVSYDAYGNITTITTNGNSVNDLYSKPTWFDGYFGGMRSINSYTGRTTSNIDTVSISNAIVEGFKKIQMLNVELTTKEGSTSLNGTMSVKK